MGHFFGSPYLGLKYEFFMFCFVKTGHGQCLQVGLLSKFPFCLPIHEFWNWGSRVP